MGDEYLLLVNPSAGGGRAARLLPRVERALAAAGVPYRLVCTDSLDHGAAEACAAAEAGVTPIVMSGDGLVGRIGGALAGAEVPLAVIPGGRGNDFARSVGIPSTPERAVQLIAEGTIRSIDVGEANGRHFLCVASCGFDSDTNRIANEAKLIRGAPVYFYASLRTLATWKPARFTVAVDGDTRAIPGYSVAVANSPSYGGGMQIAPNAELDDGLLEVVWIGEMAKLRALRSMPKVYTGTHLDEPAIGLTRGREVRLEADRPFAVYADGEHLTDLPATIRLRPRALNIIAPPG